MTVYCVGTTPAIVHDGSAILVPADPALGVRIWEIVSRGSWEPMDIIEVLSSDGLAKTPAFGVAALRDGRLVVMARGGVVVDVWAGDGVEHIDGGSAVTWVERTFDSDGEMTVILRVSESSGEWLPVSSGVVMADQVRIGPDRTYLPTEATDSADVEDDLVNPAVLSEPAEADSAAASESEPAEEAPKSSGADPFTTMVEDVALVEEEPSDEAVVDGHDEQAPSPAVSPSDPNATLADVDQSRFDAMFGATIVGRRLEDAAVREPEDPAALVPPPPAVSEVPAPPEPPLGGVPDAPQADALGDHGGDTISAAELARIRADAQSAPQSPLPPVPPPPAVAMTATLTLSTGRTVTLDRPVVIGRAPRSHGATSAELPQTVVIDNPYISSTHLVVAIDDGVVTAVDRSTNGTLLTRPGQQPVRLDKGRETIITDGCVLSLSDDITVRLSVTRGGTA